MRPFPARHPHLTAAALCCASLIAVPAPAQEVTYQVLLDESDAIDPWGNRPGLHGGFVAFLGTDEARATDAIFLGPVGGPYEIVVQRDDPIPNRPGFTFHFLDNPAAFNGQAVFTGGRASDLNDGIYTGDAAGFTTVHDARGLGFAWPRFPCPIDAGIAFELDPGRFHQPFFVNYDGTLHFPADSQVAAPGGGVFASFDIPDNLSAGGDQAVFSAIVSHGSTTDGGMYTWDALTLQLDLVANWTTPMPGLGRLFDFFIATDTDGENVAFVGKEGFVGFGGIHGVFTAPVGAGGAGPVAAVALEDEPSPAGGRPYIFFGYVAIDGDAVYFDATIGDAQPGYGLFASIGGVTVPLLTAGQVIDGKTIVDGRLHPNAVDGRSLVCRARYATGSGGLGEMLLLITVGDACAADWNGDDGLTSDDFFAFLDDFFGEGGADFNGDGSTTSDDFFSFLSAFFEGC